MSVSTNYLRTYRLTPPPLACFEGGIYNKRLVIVLLLAETRTIIRSVLPQEHHVLTFGSQLMAKVHSSFGREAQKIEARYNHGGRLTAHSSF